MIQQVMALELDKDNARKAKANDSYYLLPYPPDSPFLCRIIFPDSNTA